MKDPPGRVWVCWPVMNVHGQCFSLKMVGGFLVENSVMAPPKTIVITGSTRGIGYGLAESFLGLGCAVVVSGRSRESTAAAVRQLAEQHDPGRVFGLACDVTVSAQVTSLWDESAAHFGQVDIWVNNAGYTGEMGMAWERPAEEVQSVIATNLVGTIFGSQIALRGMQKQGHGAIYNMEGMGGDGRKHAGLTFYGTTKYAVHYFTESLALEAKDTRVIVGGLRPGMVATNLLRDRYKDRPDDWERAKKIFNILAERVERVTPWLARQMLSNHKNGAILSYSSSWKMLWKFIRSPFGQEKVFD
ncbi:MAG: SDR family oxidoreductase [Chloroflexi bacterium]|nr:MAG: SDR family oxidoreductase [Chloroflexota bacterium]